MAENSRIEWTHHTVNFWHGCSKVSPGCANCYAETLDARFHPLRADRPGRARHWGNAPRMLRVEAGRREALKYERRAVKEGVRFRVFTQSMGDFFEDRGDLDVARLEALDVIRQTPHLDWLVLTKRPENVLPLLARAINATDGDESLGELHDWLHAWGSGFPPANVWLGTSVEDQERADLRIPALLQVPAAVRFLSCEPLLGPVDLTGLGLHKGWCPTHDFPGGFCHGSCPDDRRLDWVICGGESGPHARPMLPEYPRGLRDQCAAARVPFFFKQWGEFCCPDQLPPEAFVSWDAQENAAGNPDLERPLRFGKARSGRLLDEVVHSAFPEVAHA